MSTTTTTTTTPEETLQTLTTRLRRLEFLLAGTTSSPSETLSTPRDTTLTTQLHTLHRDLQKLQQKSRTVTEILQIHASFPTFFTPTRSLPSTSPLEKAATILTAASEFHSTASQLAAINDTPIPPPGVSAGLVELLPRIQRAEVVQAAQEKKVAELRARTAKVLEGWFLCGVQGVNECFAEWDERTFVCEKVVGRRLVAEKEEY
ncbi:hypothetical protein BDD12DRAFT_874818 [Trichophaea hybrida]|nr:hypothetical protein BDD12DRAFT_874818 [Trichophaea hybrida]